MKFFIFTVLFFKFSLASLIYTPSKLDPKTANVVVVIHGCLQNPEAMAFGTGWNELADANNLVVIYPKVDGSKNDLGCWSWYLDENQKSTSGELKEIKNQIDETVKGFKLKKPKIYVTGISSGGATVAGLVACYPAFFASAGIHSAPSYGLAKNITEAQSLLKEGPKDKKQSGSCTTQNNKTPIIVIQGTDDKVVHPTHALKIMEDFIGTKESKSTQKESANDFKYEISNFLKNGIAGRVIMVEGLGHAWAGFENSFTKPTVIGPRGKFAVTLPFFTEKGPSSTQLIWNFFKETGH
jgi:poly(hydroxyalkanoate) depolymerase family esterase